MSERERDGARERVVALDVRPLLAEGVDPLEVILAEIARIGPAGALLVTAPFRPEPLEALLGERGWRASARRLVDGAGHVVEFLGKGCPEPVDLTAFEAPEPLARILERVASLAPGEVVVFRLPRRPALLPARLAPAVRLAMATAPDGGTLARVELPTAGAR